MRSNDHVTVDFERLARHLAASIRLGYEVEADGPNVAFSAPRNDEVRWLAACLVSEGWTRAADWRRE